MTIKYKICEDTSTVTVYLDSIFKANITKLMALINEIDLYHNYVPFCERSITNK
jgi:ribosome-associated toxin RatA of RatAB toxin-antitoxin module